MKKIIYICFFALFTFISCKQNDIIDKKDGISLPTVENLTLEQTSDPKKVKLTWSNPQSIPGELKQPLSIYIEVTEFKSVTKFLPTYSVTLPDFPTEFLYEIPDAAKTYHFTVKVYGETKSTDPNYSSRIYSAGQTVIYN